MRFLRYALLLAVAVTLVACAEATPYRPISQESEYGYSETKLDGDTWRIQVAGNSSTGRSLVENQLLYRAAEVALANGADGFVVLEEDLERDIRYRAIGPAYDPFFAYPYGRFWGGYPGWRGYRYGAFGPAFPPDYQQITRYTAYAQIRLYKGEPPQGLGPSYVAAEVLENLAGKINRQPMNASG